MSGTVEPELPGGPSRHGSAGARDALTGDLARMRVALERAEAREAAVFDLIRTIAGSVFDLDTVLQSVLDQAVRLCHADHGNIARREGDQYRVCAFVGTSEHYERLARARIYVPERGSVIGRAVLERRVVHIADVLDDADYALADMQREAGYRTVLGVPLLREGAPLGAIAVGRSDVRPFEDAEIRLVRTFAEQAVVAIENVRLFQMVERQRSELARFAPQAATLIVSDEGEALLRGHRGEITVLFSDLRGFTAFAETAEPEEVLAVLRAYHRAVGETVNAHRGFVEHFAGDGVMALFNDPAPDPDHVLAAVRAATMIRDRVSSLEAAWHKRGYDLGLGIGIATGYATLGRIGFEGRYDYAAVGGVVNLASRLSDVAGSGEILISQRVHAAVEDDVDAEPAPGLQLKGFSRPVAAFRVRDVRR